MTDLEKQILEIIESESAQAKLKWTDLIQSTLIKQGFRQGALFLMPLIIKLIEQRDNQIDRLADMHASIDFETIQYNNNQELLTLLKGEDI